MTRKTGSKLGRLAIFLLLCFFVFSGKPARAGLIPFVDTRNYWPGWGNGSSDDSSDTIGVPNFLGGSATVTKDILSSLSFNRSPGTAYYSIISPGDLFIDLGSDKTWDYVVDLTDWASSGWNVPDPGAGNYNIYSIGLGLNSATGYIKSGTDNKNGWSGYGIRDGHPVATDLPLLNGQSVYFSGWGTGSTTNYSFNLAGLNGGGLDLGDSGTFTIGWGVNCANDVIYEKLNYAPVPEPATMSLLGLGILGLLGLKRKKTK